MKSPTLPLRALALALGASAVGCAQLRPVGTASEQPARAAAERASPAREAAPASPWELTPADGEAARIHQAARQDPRRRVLVSIEERALWLMEGEEPLMAAPVAVGMEEDFVWDGRRYDFDTPRGIRRVLAKSPDPLWVPPEWHYFEIAAEHGVEPVQLRAGQVVRLEDGTRIEVREREVGRVNLYGNFWPFTPGVEIVFEGKVFIPPYGTRQRQVPEILGTHKLELGDGYLLHGTNEESSIGAAVSHGCVRMYNDDVARLYDQAPVGTPVYIY